MVGLAVVCALLVGDEAAARVGGGQSFGGGSSSGGGRSGGSGGGDGDLIWFLIWLCLEHPMIGIPVTLVVVGVVVVKQFANRAGGGRRWASHEPAHRPPKARRARRSTTQALRAADPNFSEPLFLDYAQLVYARAHTLRPADDRPTGLVSQAAWRQLRQRAAGVERVEDVIFGATRVSNIDVGGQWVSVQVAFTTNLTESRAGAARQLLLDEVWTFRRAAGVLSPGPERMRSLGCASCGSTLEPGTDGRCPNCEQPRTGGQLQWEVVSTELRSSQALSRPDLHLGGGVEPGTRAPTVKHPQLASRRRAFQARHADFDWSGFKARVVHIFGELQQAWSTQTWERARPYETDALFQVHRFWMERYARFGLANRIDDVEVLKMELADVDLDAWLETMTVRVWARMRDWTEETATGKVVGGSKSDPRAFSEYWTFIRAVGAEDRGSGPRDGRHCPSCGAPLDKVGAAGVCGYCDAKITGGDYDWVLSRIEQDESYGR